MSSPRGLEGEYAKGSSEPQPPIRGLLLFVHSNQVFAGPKRGRPTPGFSIFIRSDRASEQAPFVSLDQILVPTHSLRDKGPQGQHRNTGTIQEQRDNTGTKEQRNKGT